MKRYDTLELSDPATYAADPELATLARKVADKHFQPGAQSRGDFKRAVLAGQHPELVRRALEQSLGEQDAQACALADTAAVVATLQLPDGYAAAMDGDTIILTGPFSEDLHARLKRAGGYWDGGAHRNRKCWVMPADKAASIKRIFANSKKAAASTTVASATREIERWLGYVEQKSPEGYLYERGVAECRSRGIAQHPALLARLDAAITQARQVRAVAEKRREEEKAARHQQYATERAASATTRQKRVLFPDGCGPALDQPMRRGQRVLVFTSTGKPFRIGEDDASVYGSHLLGHEGEYGRYYYWREASADEITQLVAREEAAAAAALAKQARENEIARIRDLIKTTGERPEGSHTPEGARLLNTQTLYGGGDWFVVGPDWIWYCQNNGADGDNWALNNVRTGGAGAIGWRVPFSAELGEAINKLAGGVQ